MAPEITHHVLGTLSGLFRMIWKSVVKLHRIQVMYQYIKHELHNMTLPEYMGNSRSFTWDLQKSKYK